MADAEHEEDQQEEQESLEAIFDEDFTIISKKKQLREYDITLVPNPGGDEEENKVAIIAYFKLPANYPETVPTIKLRIKYGLPNKHLKTLQEMANNAAAENKDIGAVSIWEICSVLQEWLVDNNVAEKSMHEAMMARATISEDEEEEEEEEEADMHKRKYPEYKNPFNIGPEEIVTVESFAEWRKKFDQEKENLKPKEEDTGKKDKLTGKQMWQQNLVKGLVEKKKEKKEEEEVFWFNEGIYDLDDDEDFDISDLEETDEDINKPDEIQEKPKPQRRQEKQNPKKNPKQDTQKSRGTEGKKKKKKKKKVVSI